MYRPSWKSLVFGAVIVTALFAVVDQANAWCGGCGAVPLYGPFPAYTAWDSCCGGDWYLGCRPGPVRRLVFGPYRWYGGWYGSYGCCYPTYSCCYPTYSCCGDTTYTGTITLQGSTTAPGQPTPAIPTPAKKPVIEAPATPVIPSEPGTTPTPATPTPALPGAEPATPGVPGLPGVPSTSVTPDNSGILTVWVPYDAKVTINGMTTKSIGSRRLFVSYDLKDGFSYKYEVKAEVVRDGKIIEDTKTAVLTAGSNNTVAFGQFYVAPAEGLAAK